VLADIKNNENLQSIVQNAKFRDIVDKEFNLNSSYHRFMALECLWTTDVIEDFQMILGTDVYQPFIDYEALTEYLSLWSTDIAIVPGKELDEMIQKQA
jgi:hypothetical protein